MTAAAASGRWNLPRGGSPPPAGEPELMEEGAREGKGGDYACPCGFDGGGHGLPCHLLA
jgi:hypothetical protein